ncbi:unnamed protein product [Cyprideis torosa]|uniref:Uncharacterized protein n=1 Tax=Cyprideis torosa TaxID=163714 RepID=A0A7R8ZLI0_9CRUS|nr:unnamed protein product [Cyprideis torosa]CAG0883754.1 unnamed protein product [Cyprideis torosa]
MCRGTHPVNLSFQSAYKMQRGSISGYFLAGRHMWWLPVGASIFASNIGSEHFVGLAGSGAAAGIGLGAYEVNVCTLPEYMHKRFGGQRIRIYLAVLSLVLYIFIKISVNLYSGALFIKTSLGWDLYVSVILLLTVTLVTTVAGGLTAVIYTDTLQFFIMIIGALVVMIKSLHKVGWYDGLIQSFMRAIPEKHFLNSTCGFPPRHSFVMLRALDDPDIPWLGFLVGASAASIWYWCADQIMVQRVLAARSLSHAQGATLFAGYFKILPFFIMVLPGMVARVLYTDELACILPEECERICDSRRGCSNLAYPKLVLGIMPEGFRGIMMAVMLAALMSDLTSIFNSSSTLFTMDIWQRIRPSAKTRELLVVGRVFVCVMVALSVLWIPVIQATEGGQLYAYIQNVASNLTPPICSVYTVSIFWKRLTEKLHYMYFALTMFLLIGILTIVISYLTEPIEEWRLIRTTFQTRFDSRHRPDEGENPELMNDEEDAVRDEEEYDFEGTGTVPVEQGNAFEMEKATKNSETKVMSLRGIDSHTPLQVHVKRPLRWSRKLVYFVCGFSHGDHRTENLELQHHLEDLRSLKQEPYEKWILNINLVFICIVATAIYIYYSMDPLTDGEYERILNETLGQWNFTSDVDVEPIDLFSQ